MRLPNFERRFSLVVWGDGMAAHLKRARAVEQLGVSGLVIGECRADDRWLFGNVTEPPNLSLDSTG